MKFVGGTCVWPWNSMTSHSMDVVTPVSKSTLGMRKGVQIRGITQMNESEWVLLTTMGVIEYIRALLPFIHINLVMEHFVYMVYICIILNTNTQFFNTAYNR